MIPHERFDVMAYALETKQRIQVRVSSAPDGSPITIPLVLITGRARRRRVAMVAGIHGDEYEGPQALAELATEISPTELNGTLLVIPVAHIPAFNAGTRTSPIDGLNLARVFPGNNEGSITERIAHALFHELLAGVDHLADLHSAGTRKLHLPLAGFYEVPGPVGEASRNAALAWGLRYVWSAPLRAGVLSYEAIIAGIPATGGEVGGQGMARSEDVA